MRPIRVHLDTSDYSVMYRAEPGTATARIRDWLKTMAERRQVEIGLSYHVVFELLQKAEPKYREDRLARARLLTDLCGRNAFPYPTDLGQGPRFSTEGLWVPRIDLEDVEIERVIEHVRLGIARHPNISRYERRVLSKAKYFARWAISNPAEASRTVLDVWPLKFGQAFVEGGNFIRYMLGAMSRDEANKELWFYITDPVTVYEVWFEQYGRDEPITERRDKLASGFISMLDGLQSQLNESKRLRGEVEDALAATGDAALPAEEHEKLSKLRSDIKTFQTEINSPEDLYERTSGWRERFGAEAALVAAQILYAYHREKRPIKQSDGIDFVHAMYLPYTDLWRGDKAFSDLLVKHRVNFSDRIVGNLADLPARIGAEIRKQGNIHQKTVEN